MSCQGCAQNMPITGGYPYGYQQNYSDQMNSYPKNIQKFAYPQGGYPAFANYGYNNYAYSFQPQQQQQKQQKYV